MKTKLLVTGSIGQLGVEFCNYRSDLFEMTGISKRDADIRDYKPVISAVNRHKPDIIIHSAAMTDVDACEKDQSLAMDINVGGTRNVALAAEKSGAAIIYFSTDYVFDGKKERTYVESDKPNPISHYGFTKLTGEKVVREFHGNWTIIRTGWVYSPNRKNFVKSIVSTANKEKGPVKVVNDQYGSPTWTREIVKQTIKIIEASQTGIFHVAAKGEVSRFEFAKLILNRLLPDVEIVPCATKEFPRPAKRPARSSLNSERLEALGIDVMRSVETGLDEFLNEFGEQLINEMPN